MSDVTAIARGIQHRTHNDGPVWMDRQSNLQRTLNDFKALTPEQRNQVATKLTYDDLQELADDVNSRGLGGAAGLSADEKRDLFTTLAQGLDGTQLNRLTRAFEDRNDIRLLTYAISRHASVEVQAEFIRQTIQPQSQEMQAEICSRPLQGSPFGFRTSGRTGLDLGLYHEHIFYSNQTNTGYGSEGAFSESSRNGYQCAPEKYNGEVMQQAVANIRSQPNWTASDYDVVTHNCQDFVSEVLAEYQALMARNEVVSNTLQELNQMRPH